MLLVQQWSKNWCFDPPAQAHPNNDAQDVTSCLLSGSVGDGNGLSGGAVVVVIEQLEIVINVDFIKVNMYLHEQEARQ